MDDITKQISALVQSEVEKQTSTVVNQKLDTLMEVIEAMRNGGGIRELDDEIRQLESDLAYSQQVLKETEAENEKLTAEIEHRKDENKKLLDMVGEIPKDLHCEECGVLVEPVKKIVKVRKAYCYEHAPNPEKAKNNQKYEDYITEEKRSHKALEPEVKFSELATIVRSESQQARRAREALEAEAAKYAKSEPKHHSPKTPKTERECTNCGKPTNKLYCSDKCRKEYEQQLVNTVTEANKPPELEPEELEEATLTMKPFGFTEPIPYSGNKPKLV